MSLPIDKYFYGVIAIPNGISTSCRWESETQSVPPSPPPYCNPNEWNDYWNNQFFARGSQQFHCVPITYNTRAGSCSQTFSVYQQLGGDPQNPGPFKSVPSIGGNYPINLSANQQQEAQLGNTYAVGTWPTAFISSPDAKKQNTNLLSAAIVVAYDITWFKSIEDLMLINPQTSSFLNRASLTGTPPNTFQYQIQGSSETAGQPIPNIDDQYYAIATSICGGISTRCKNTLNPQFGWPFCSNFYDLTAGNPCADILTSVTSPTNTGPPPDPQIANAYQQASNNYCNNFNSDNIPPECQCINRTLMPDYNQFYSLFEKDPIGVPPDKCWWRPCKDPTLALVPVGTINPNQPCPSICSQVVDFIGNKNVNFQNVNISQELSCCQNGSTPSNCILSSGSNCPSNTTPGPNDTCVPITNKTFWQKYGKWIIVAFVILLVIIIAIVIAILIANDKKKK